MSESIPFDLFIAYMYSFVRQHFCFEENLMGVPLCERKNKKKKGASSYNKWQAEGCFPRQERSVWEKLLPLLLPGTKQSNPLQRWTGARSQPITSASVHFDDLVADAENTERVPNGVGVIGVNVLTQDFHSCNAWNNVNSHRVIHFMFMQQTREKMLVYERALITPVKTMNHLAVWSVLATRLRASNPAGSVSVPKQKSFFLKKATWLQGKLTPVAAGRPMTSTWP